MVLSSTDSNAFGMFALRVLKVKSQCSRCPWQRFRRFQVTWKALIEVYVCLLALELRLPSELWWEPFSAKNKLCRIFNAVPQYSAV
jgi:hypothetical protein